MAYELYLITTYRVCPPSTLVPTPASRGQNADERVRIRPYTILRVRLALAHSCRHAPLYNGISCSFYFVTLLDKLDFFEYSVNMVRDRVWCKHSQYREKIIIPSYVLSTSLDSFNTPARAREHTGTKDAEPVEAVRKHKGFPRGN